MTTNFVELRERLARNITLFSHDQAALLKLVDAKIEGIPDTVAVLQRLYQVATQELRNTSLLMSSPPQSSAAWDVRNAISKEIEALGAESAS